MAKEKKIVDITKDDKSSKESYGKDKHGNIIKLEDKGDQKERAKTKRILSFVFWALAICFEVFAVLRWYEKITWLGSIDTLYFVIGCLVLDAVFVLVGSSLWKKANHLDPASEKEPTKFWLHNNLGVIMSVIAFVPFIVLALLNKDADKKSKTIVTVVAAILLVAAGLGSYDFNPVSSEQLQKAEQEVLQVSETGTVYWAPNSKKYHVDPDCPSFSNSETVYEGTVKQAFEHNLTEPCRRCIPEMEEEEE